MTVGARLTVLQAIARALRGEAAAAAPPPLHGDEETRPSELAELVRSFGSELTLLGGGVTTVEDAPACAADIDRRLRAAGAAKLAVQSSPLAREVARNLSGIDVIVAREAPLAALETCGCSLVEAQALLADTGSALVLADNSGDRTLPYLARTCFVVTTMEKLHPTLNSAALLGLQQAAQSGARGEAVIVTGPSRTADIEKILILGAHGPAELHVFILEKSPP